MALNETGIIWTEKTWNPWSGCKKISPGCKFCYAYSLAENKRGTPAFPNGFDITFRPHKYREVSRLKEPALVFVNSMSDFALKDEEFGLEPGTMDSYRDRLVDEIEATPQHEYQVLTKRPEEMLRYSKRRKLPPNFWAGVSLDVKSMESRLDVLRQIDTEIRFVSAEPILSELPDLDLSGIHWLIGGGESGQHLMRPEIREKRSMANYDPKVRKWWPRDDRYHWATGLRDQCQTQGVKFFWKQWGGFKPTSAGRDLDGRTWDEFPRLPGGGTATVNAESHRLEIVKPEQLSLV